MQLSLQTWNGNNINNATPFDAVILPGQLTNLRANPITVARADDWPALSTTVLTSNVFVIQVLVHAGQSIDTSRELLKSYFDVNDKQRHNLVAYDLADSNRPWYLTGMPVLIVQEAPNKKNSFYVSLATEMGATWRLVTAITDAWSITGTGQTKAVTNIGNAKSKPLYTFTPTVAKSNALSYRRWCPIYNNMDISVSDTWDITGGGLDTAALTTAKMQADGDDLRVWKDGVEVDRWLDAMDTAATKVWVNIAFAPRQEGTTSVSIAGSGAVSTITFADTQANRQFLQALAIKVNKVLLLEDEAYTYTSVNLVTRQATGCTRAQKGTSMAAHSAGITARWIEHDIWILYGDSALTAPVTDDDFKPLFSLASTNGSRVYTNFFDTTANRPGAWTPEVTASKSQLSYYFTANQNTFANPATELGVALLASSESTNNIGETGTADWLYHHACGVTNVLYSGKKYDYDLDDWPTIVGLQYLQPDTAWFTAQTEVIPSVAQTWQSFGANNIALGGTYETIRLCVEGTLSPIAAQRVMAQFDTVTLTLASANLPTFAVGAEQAANMFDFVLTNNTTGEYIKCKTPCAVNDTLYIDTENKLSYLSDGSRVSIILSAPRTSWLDLKALVSNTLQFDDTGTNAITAAVVHRDRNM